MNIIEKIIIACIFLFLLVLIISLVNNHRERKLIKRVTSLRRGNKEERRFILHLLKKGITAEHIFHDVYLRKANGKVTQIDCVVICKIGILVIEIKHYKGWIFGSGQNRQWTQVLNYGREKYKFYNPILQNTGHIQALKEQSPSIKEIPIYNIVVFSGDCKLKNLERIPTNTWVGNQYSFLKNIPKWNKMYSTTELKISDDIISILNQGVENGKNNQILIEHAQHVMNSKKMSGY